jgi:hypothetical protein
MGYRPLPVSDCRLLEFVQPVGCLFIGLAVNLNNIVVAGAHKA